MQHHPLLSKPIISLSFSIFAIGVSEFIVIGLLAQIAKSLHLNLADASLVVVAYALGISIGSPLLARITRARASRSVCVSLMLYFIDANLVVALVSNIVVVLLARLVAGAAHGGYFSVASAVAPELVQSKKQTQAIAVMFSGLTLAMIIGVPIGVTIGHDYNWQSVFVLISLLTVWSCLGVYLFLPKRDDAIDTTSSPVLKAYLSRGLVTLYTVTIFGFGGGFIFFSYIEPFMQHIPAFSMADVSRAMLIVGIGSLFGNVLGGCPLYSGSCARW